MNMINGKLVRKAGGLAFSGNTVEFFLPSTLGKALWKSRVAINEDVSLGVGPLDTNTAIDQGAGRFQSQGEVVTLEGGGSLRIVFIMRSLTGELIRSIST